MSARLTQLIYRLMRDHDITAQQMFTHIQECKKPGRPQYSRVGLGKAAGKLARALDE